MTSSQATQKLSEKIVTKQCVDFMRAHGWRAIRLQSGLFSRPLSQSRVRIGESGMPDWLFLRPLPSKLAVSCLFVEIKGTGGKRSHEQDAWAWEAQRDGFDVWCVDNFEQFEESYRARYVD